MERGTLRESLFQLPTPMRGPRYLTTLWEPAPMS